MSFVVFNFQKYGIFWDAPTVPCIYIWTVYLMGRKSDMCETTAVCIPLQYILFLHLIPQDPWYIYLNE